MKYIKVFLYFLLIGFYGVCKSDEPCCYENEYLESAWTFRLEGGYSVGRFIGLKTNYGELDFFIASPVVNGFEPFLDIRGYRFDNGDWGASTGIGLRAWDPFYWRLWGFNVYYDFRDGCFESFHRVGVGFESLGDCWDLRVNTYFPIGGSLHHSKLHTFDDFIGDFVATCREQQFQFCGIDAEIGSRLWNCWDCFYLYGALGPYCYFNEDSGHVWGGYGRFELNVLQYLSLEVLVSSDSEFKTNIQGRILLSIPLWSCYPWQCCCKDFITQRVRRNGVIFTENCCDWDWNWDDGSEEVLSRDLLKKR